jgi:NTE family protein
MPERALVLAGGGVAGIAWELGMIDELRRAGIDLGAPDLILGTSGGSVVGAQLATGQLDAAIAMQERAATTEIAAELDLAQLLARGAEIAREASDPTDAGRRWGAYALAARTVPEAARRAAVAARLPVQTWPQQPLQITAVDAASGALAVFDRTSGVSLLDAVTASCAVPGVWPPATIGERRYLDGGIRSFSNANLARDHHRVLVLAPIAVTDAAHRARFDAELATLERVLVVEGDSDSVAAIGANPLDPTRRKPALDAGRQQARRVADQVRAFWA